MTERVCESCAAADEELFVVRRVYVTPEQWDIAATSRTLEEPELWCFTCVSMYPHEPVEDPPA